MKIACVTYENENYASSIKNEDIVLVQYLQEKGIDVKIEVWTDSNVKWETYDVIIVKSPWDYHYKLDQFNTWLEMLKCQNIRILNPYDKIKWNSDKHYLQHIENAGLNIIPTFWLKKNEKPDLLKYFKLLCTEKIVIKPSISARFYYTAFHESNTNNCVLKTPKSGDFRVQSDFGGVAHLKSAPNQLIQYAKKYVEIFAKDCLFTRVDGLDIDGQFFLIELELIEPYLFLLHDKNSFERFYKALKQLLNIN
ncbi:unnamed protein product [Adineta steineri]|uniref:Prokaryotic glutathione synthetase ATP-binding domain-containing protein n=1 Tax=Adineta steineri TaxID=433720 RepID=A0A814G9G5_9BILA|nr:unnamed protein product [Adineta steineri]CAF4047565.1 unnamed protein product [Adineta steineri]